MSQELVGRTPSGFVPIFEPEPGTLVNAAVRHCGQCGAVISGNGGPSRNAWCISCTRQSLASNPQPVDGDGELAPANSLPTWGDCALRVGNSDFIAKRVAEGGYGAEPDTLLASELHRFIYEYDDADSYRSAWFLHRLERVLDEVRASCDPEGRFEHYVSCGIANAPNPLRELGEYLTRVLDEDQFPSAEALLLQLATHPPQPVSPEVVEALAPVLAEMRYEIGRTAADPDHTSAAVAQTLQYYVDELEEALAHKAGG